MVVREGKHILPYSRQCVDEDDIRHVLQVLRSDWLTTGPKVKEFEESFAQYVGAGYVVSFSSGTAALHGLVSAAGIGPGCEVITSPMTFCATASCVLYGRGKPVLADVCDDTLYVDPDEVARHASSRTRAILAVDYAGHPADLDALEKLAEQKDLVLIEDACHAPKAEYQGRLVGALSDMTVFSFHPVKHITTGEGGMVTTDDVQFARRLRMFRNHGIDRDAGERHTKGEWYYEMVTLGYNYRLTGIACALGFSQLRKLDRNLVRRREIAERYRKALQSQPGIVTPAVRPNVVSSWHLCPIRLDFAKLRKGRDKIFRALGAEGIGVNVHYIPVHLHPCYKDRLGYRGGEYPIAERAFARLISLLLFHEMSNEDVEDLIEAVTKVAKRYAA